VGGGGGRGWGLGGGGGEGVGWRRAIYVAPRLASGSAVSRHDNRGREGTISALSDLLGKRRACARGLDHPSLPFRGRYTRALLRRRSASGHGDARDSDLARLPRTPPMARSFTFRASLHRQPGAAPPARWISWTSTSRPSIIFMSTSPAPTCLYRCIGHNGGASDDPGDTTIISSAYMAQ